MMTKAAILTAHCMALMASNSPIDAKCIPVIEKKMYQLVVQAVSEMNACVGVLTKGEVSTSNRYCLTKRGK